MSDPVPVSLTPGPRKVGWSDGQPPGARDQPVSAAARDNPVDWYPWGEEALARAREEDRPILLSVGYSACHWCHVMERESFEDPETAAYMNEHFVNVKVDREERPDVDAIYMEAVQAMTGHGGWPMTVFLDPDGRAVLRRHLLPARREPRDAELPHGHGSGPRRLRAPARRDPRSRAARPERGSGRSGRSSRPASRSTPRCSTRPSRALLTPPTRSTAASAAPQVPAASRARAAARQRRDATWSRRRSTR